MIPALVLTAGLATRLRPLSLVRAKAALPVGGVPLVARILDRLRDAGVSDAVLNLHHLPHTVTSRIGDGTSLGIRVRYSWQRALLGSAGDPKLAAPLMGSPTFLVVNGDTLADVDIAGLIADHRASGALVTMATTPNREPDKYGGVVSTAGGAVSGFVKEGAHAPSEHFVGVQVVDARAFDSVPADTPWESVAALYPALIAAARGSVRAFSRAVAFQDIGTPEDYLATALRAQHADAVHTAPPGVVDSVLWDAVTVGDGASVRRAIVTDGVHVPAGTAWSHCTIRRAETGPLLDTEQRHGNLAVAPLRQPRQV